MDGGEVAASGVTPRRAGGTRDRARRVELISARDNIAQKVRTRKVDLNHPTKSRGRSAGAGRCCFVCAISICWNSAKPYWMSWAIQGRRGRATRDGGENGTWGPLGPRGARRGGDTARHCGVERAWTYVTRTAAQREDRTGMARRSDAADRGCGGRGRAGARRGRTAGDSPRACGCFTQV